MTMRTLKDLLAAGRGDTVAIAAPDATPLTYDGLRAVVAETVSSLNAFGVGRQRPGRDSPAERPGDGDGLSRHRVRARRQRR